MAEQERPGGAPTEEPTPRRRREARRRGEVAVSRELTSAAVLAAATAALAAIGAESVVALAALVRRGLADAATPRAVGAALGVALAAGARAVAPLLAAAVAVGGLVAFLQVGPLVAPASLAPRLGRLGPGAALRRLTGDRGAWPLVKAALKLGVVGWAAWAAVAPRLGALVALPRRPPGALASLLGGLLLSLLGRAAAGLAGVGAIDLALARRALGRRLRMTRVEVERERREEEGDPHGKAERERRRRELAREAGLAAVARADCVIVNPTHVAVALRYDRGTMEAPEVVAKGEHALAERIVAEARRAGVPVLRDVPLARALVRLEPGDVIPEALYDAVAEVLAFLGGLGAG